MEKTIHWRLYGKKTYITREGVSLLGISDAAETIGFKTLGVRMSFEKLSLVL
jgi:ATP-binding cassette subfamily B protein